MKNRAETYKRSGEDRRGKSGLFFLNGSERCNNRERRQCGEKRKGWGRVNKWSSVLMESPPLLDTIIRLKLLMGKFETDADIKNLSYTDIAESMFLMEEIERLAIQRDCYPGRLRQHQQMALSDEDLFTINIYHQWFENLYINSDISNSDFRSRKFTALARLTHHKQIQ